MTCLQLDILDGIAHADGQRAAVHQELDSVVQLLCQIP